MSVRAHEDGTPDGPASGRGDDWRRQYWRKNIRLVGILLAVWFTVSFVFGILLIEPLNAIEIAGFPLGLWFAQQGSIYTFVLLILIYALAMDRLDKKFGVAEVGAGAGGEQR